MRRKSLNFHVITLAATITVGCSPHMHYAQARLYADAVTTELVRAGACPSIEVCKGEQMVKWEAGGWKIGPFNGGGVDIQVYRVADRRTADALITRCSQIYAANPKVAASITIQSNAHIDNNHPGERTIIKEARFQARAI